jgi:predicted RNase H-like HicB family nuclease
MKVTARVSRETDGSYWAEVSELPGCFASGLTMDELLEDLRGAIHIYTQPDDARSEQASQPGPRSIQVDEIKVLV